MENIIKYLQLYFTKGIGNKTLRHLIDYFGSVEKVYNSSFEEIENIFSKNTAQLIFIESLKNKEKAEKELLKAEKFGINIVCYEDKNYPENLKNIPDPPAVLYIKGKLPENYYISIVGTRNPTNYGKKITKILVKELVINNICVVSGGAYGIDSIAHKAALENDGKTIAVLGTGIDIIYPYSNKGLFEKIAEKGALISEFPLGTKPSKFNFPLRNRIVAGISQATVVVEAPEKSGSLITAKLANEYGKPVFSVPSNIDNPQGKGCNLLINEGAIPVLDEKTVFEEISYLKNKTNNGNSENLSNIETKIIENIENEIHIDTLSEKLSIPVSELIVVLFELELKGLIKNENGLISKLTL
jgi:DNA processing protein